MGTSGRENDRAVGHYCKGGWWEESLEHCESGACESGGTIKGRSCSHCESTFELLSETSTHVVGGRERRRVGFRGTS
jgi:hypothetical protein